MWKITERLEESQHSSQVANR